MPSRKGCPDTGPPEDLLWCVFFWSRDPTSLPFFFFPFCPHLFVVTAMSGVEGLPVRKVSSSIHTETQDRSWWRATSWKPLPVHLLFHRITLAWSSQDFLTLSWGDWTETCRKCVCVLWTRASLSPSTATPLPFFTPPVLPPFQPGHVDAWSVPSAPTWVNHLPSFLSLHVCGASVISW